ncbi:MAG: family 20 glycosylhydrolase [Alistipes sp.]|nr:family 20 glycosylhydrolase [Alistipes sp.]
MTLLQLLPANVYNGGLTGSAEVVCCEISDSPRYEHRGFMLDVCRTWMDKEAVMNFIDLLAYHKINSLRLHLTDDEAWRLEIKSHPELAEVGGFRGGDSPIWPRYGKWNEKWGGYYTQEDMREIIAYAAVRNIEIIPEIDLPGHSLCMATMHPEILCDYTRTNSASYGYDTRSAFCASREENYELLADILGEVCELFPAEHIHIGGDEVDMSQWKRCPRCQALMRDNNMTNTTELQQYFMSRLTDILAQHGKKPAVWNEAIDGGKLSTDTRVYGWESIKECRTAAANYNTIVMPGQFFYFDMKQSAREPGHDWAAIFDWTKVYNFTLASQGFTEGEQANVLGFEGSFFSEAYASRNPETPDYLHYQTFPRIVALAEVAWVNSDERDEVAFYEKMVEHYNRLDAMGVAYRLMPPKVVYEDGVLSASTDDGSRVFYRREPMDVEMLYTTPIITDKPAEYSFVSRRGEACSPEAGVASHFKTITPAFDITSSMNDSEKFSFDKAEGYGRIARTTRTGDVGDWVMFTFEQPVSCRRMKVATGNFQLPRYTFENGYVEVSYDGKTFERVGELDCGMFYIEHPARPIKAVRITCTSRGNGAEWVSIQPPTIWPKL